MMSTDSIGDGDGELNQLRGRLGGEERLWETYRENWDSQVYDGCFPLGQGIVRLIGFREDSQAVLVLTQVLQLTEAAGRSVCDRLSERKLHRLFLALLSRVLLDQGEDVRQPPPLPVICRSQRECIRQFLDEGCWTLEGTELFALRQTLCRCAVGRMGLGNAVAFLVGLVVNFDALEGFRILGGTPEVCNRWFQEARRSYARMFLHVCELLDLRDGGRPPLRFSIN